MLEASTHHEVVLLDCPLLANRGIFLDSLSLRLWLAIPKHGHIADTAAEPFREISLSY